MTWEYRNFALTRVTDQLENRANDGDANGRKVQGHAIVFNSDSVDMGFFERIDPTALDRTLADSLNGWNIVFLWEHDTRQAPLGSTRGGKLVLTKDDRGLSFELDPARLTFAQIDAIRDGDMQMSFGFSVDKQTIEEREDGTILRTIHELTLYEISAVQSPAYPATDVALRDIAAWREARAAEEPVETHLSLDTETAKDQLVAEIKKIGLETLEAIGGVRTDGGHIQIDASKVIWTKGETLAERTDRITVTETVTDLSEERRAKMLSLLDKRAARLAPRQ